MTLQTELANYLTKFQNKIEAALSTKQSVDLKDLETLSYLQTSNGGTVTFPSFLQTSALNQVKDATDFQLILAYLDAGTTDERISTVKYRSVSLASEYTDTSTYAGTAGNYRLTNLVRTFTSI